MIIKKITKSIIDVSKEIHDKFTNKEITVDQAIALFRSKVSKQDLINSMLDPHMDEEDLASAKEMLTFFYGTKFAEN